MPSKIVDKILRTEVDQDPSSGYVLARVIRLEKVIGQLTGKSCDEILEPTPAPAPAATAPAPVGTAPVAPAAPAPAAAPAAPAPAPAAPANVVAMPKAS